MFYMDQAEFVCVILFSEYRLYYCLVESTGNASSGIKEEYCLLEFLKEIFVFFGNVCC